MKKKIIITLSFVLLSVIMFAGVRSSVYKISLCEDFLAAKSKTKNIDKVYELTTERETLANIYTFSEEGFVVITEDSRLFPVIAYSWHGSYNAEENANDLQFRFLKEEIKLRKQYLDENPEVESLNQQKWIELTDTNLRPGNNFQQWPPDGTTNTDGWCKTQWDQSGVYNDLCPLDHSGNRSVVGCVATAMAQIMYFHNYAGNPVFNSSDNFVSGWWNPIYIDADHEEFDFPDWAELNTYLDDLVEHFAENEELTPTDLAALNYACGVSVEMSYSSEGSGAQTSDVASALRNKFDYDTATWNDNYGNSFYENIATDMKQMQPCEFSIYTSGWNDGHAIVCDGYNTDDYFHLNYGWGTSNIGWYYLPEGMPSNYSIIGGAVRNIEGGVIPVSVNGEVTGPSDLENCYVFLEGDDYSFEAYTDNNGEFFIDAVLPGFYTVTATLERTWFYQEEVYIDEGSNDLDLSLFNYDELTGNVNADISPEGALIAVYENGMVINTANCDANGDFAVTDILPGTYQITATLHPDYFGSSEVTVSPQNQYADVTMYHYTDEFSIQWAGAPSEEHTIVPLQISVAIRINYEDILQDDDTLISGVSFISPINSADGSIAAQLWKNEQLLSETMLTDLTAGETVECLFPQFETINETEDYFVGYSIYSNTGTIAWHDEGPRVPGKGAWFRINGWVELANVYDYNFCISAQLITGYENNNSSLSEITSANKLINCFPNPYYCENTRYEATVSFSIDSPGRVSVDCYNLKGQFVEEVYNGYSEPGEFQISWKPGSVSSGLYFYRLTLDGDIIDSQKIMIIK